MGVEQQSVDMLSLEDFKRTLDARLDEVDAALSKLNGNLSDRPAVGTFTEGKSFQSHYSAVHADLTDKARRLRSALVATQSATAKIIENYRTTEARNAATANEIASQLGDINSALKETGSGQNA